MSELHKWKIDPPREPKQEEQPPENLDELLEQTNEVDAEEAE